MLDGYLHAGHMALAGNRLIATYHNGTMESGSLETTAKNNRSRTYDSLYAGAKKTLTGGDDLLSEKELCALRATHTGCIRKPAVTVNWKNSEAVPFTSHDFVYDSTTG
eukprot:3208384-Heterocapsa_arctica.AAC.1